MNNDDIMGWAYIAEETSPDDNAPMSLKVHDGNIFYVEFDAILQSFNVMNRNKRRYLANNLSECIRSPKIQSLLADDAWFGELNHPTPVYKNVPLSSERVGDVDGKNTSHKIRRPRVDRNLLTAHIVTDAGCESGRNLAVKIVQGLKPGFSARAIAVLQMIDNLPTVIVKRLITYDWVFYPSHPEAHINSKPEFKKVGFQNNTPKPVSIQLKQLLEYAGEKNINSRVIMESFELDELNCYKGFTKDYKNIIMTDNNNTIYCNLDPKISKEVRGYLAGL